MAHISRLAALDAYQRIHDFIAEVFERQLMVSEPLGGAIDFPLSQKQLGDHLGLTSVHVNRTVNRIRSTKELSWAGKRLSIPPGSGIERYARENIARLRSFEDDVNRRAFVQ